jgi:hypothetical protein
MEPISLKTPSGGYNVGVFHSIILCETKCEHWKFKKSEPLYCVILCYIVLGNKSIMQKTGKTMMPAMAIGSNYMLRASISPST